MAGKAGGDDGAIVDINMTPFVDVVLVLLIIFLVTARLMMNPSIPVELPKGATGEESKSSPIAITISKPKNSAKEKYYINGKPVRSEDLSALIKSRLDKVGKKNLQVIIAADQSVLHGRIIWLLDTLRRMGIENYAFNIDPDNTGN